MKSYLSRVAKSADLPIQMSQYWAKENLKRELNLAGLSFSICGEVIFNFKTSDEIFQHIKEEIKEVPLVLKDPYILLIEKFEKTDKSLQLNLIEKLIDMSKKRNIKTIITNEKFFGLLRC